MGCSFHSHVSVDWACLFFFFSLSVFNNFVTILFSERLFSILEFNLSTKKKKTLQSNITASLHVCVNEFEHIAINLIVNLLLLGTFSY